MKNNYMESKLLRRVVEITLIIVFYLIMINRIKYSVEFSDESWYVAEPYVVAEKGAVPFINNVSQSPGFTIPLALAFKVFCIVNGGTDGIILFSRCLFLTVALLAALLTVGIINRYTDLKAPIIVAIPMFLASNTCSLFAINYHTIGLIYLPLILALVYAEYEDDSKRSILWGFLAGAVAVRTTMGTIQVVIALIVIFIALCLHKKTKRLVGILLGCTIVCLLMFGIIGLKYGFGFLIIWIKMFLNQAYFMIGNLADFGGSVGALIRLLKYAFAIFVVMGIAKIVIKNTFIFYFLLKISVLGLIVLGVFFTFRCADYDGIRLFLLTWFLPYFYGIYSVKKSKFNKHILIISFAYLCVYFMTSYTTIDGFGSGKNYRWLFMPILLTVIMILNEPCEDSEIDGYVEIVHNMTINLGILCTIMLLSVFRIWSVYSYIYRDDEISLLTYKVDSGIWKGLYTTELRASNVVGVEEYLKSITSDDDNVLCLDWVSFGYLMVAGKICSPTTLDASPYSYGVNTPNPYFMYFDVVNRVPDKIIYIDYGRDKIVSIDNPEWKFNEFVNSYYKPEGSYSNEIFNVREYIVSDYEEALNTAKENAVFD